MFIKFLRKSLVLLIVFVFLLQNASPGIYYQNNKSALRGICTGVNGVQNEILDDFGPKPDVNAIGIKMSPLLAQKTNELIEQLSVGNSLQDSELIRFGAFLSGVDEEAVKSFQKDGASTLYIGDFDNPENIDIEDLEAHLSFCVTNYRNVKEVVVAVSGYEQVLALAEYANLEYLETCLHSNDIRLVFAYVPSQKLKQGDFNNKLKSYSTTARNIKTVFNNPLDDAIDLIILDDSIMQIAELLKIVSDANIDGFVINAKNYNPQILIELMFCLNGIASTVGKRYMHLTGNIDTAAFTALVKKMFESGLNSKFFNFVVAPENNEIEEYVQTVKGFDLNQKALKSASTGTVKKVGNDYFNCRKFTNGEFEEYGSYILAIATMLKDKIRAKFFASCCDKAELIDKLNMLFKQHRCSLTTQNSIKFFFPVNNDGNVWFARLEEKKQLPISVLFYTNKDESDVEYSCVKDTTFNFIDLLKEDVLSCNNEWRYNLEEYINKEPYHYYAGNKEISVNGIKLQLAPPFGLFDMMANEEFQYGFGHAVMCVKAKKIEENINLIKLNGNKFLALMPLSDSENALLSLVYLEKKEGLLYAALVKPSVDAFDKVELSGVSEITKELWKRYKTQCKSPCLIDNPKEENIIVPQNVSANIPKSSSSGFLREITGHRFWLEEDLDNIGVNQQGLDALRFFLQDLLSKGKDVNTMKSIVYMRFLSFPSIRCIWPVNDDVGVWFCLSGSDHNLRAHLFYQEKGGVQYSTLIDTDCNLWDIYFSIPDKAIYTAWKNPLKKYITEHESIRYYKGDPKVVSKGIELYLTPLLDLHKLRKSGIFEKEFGNIYGMLKQKEVDLFEYKNVLSLSYTEFLGVVALGNEMDSVRKLIYFNRTEDFSVPGLEVSLSAALVERMSDKDLTKLTNMTRFQSKSNEFLYLASQMREANNRADTQKASSAGDINLLFKLANNSPVKAVNQAIILHSDVLNHKNKTDIVQLIKNARTAGNKIYLISMCGGNIFTEFDKLEIDLRIFDAIFNSQGEQNYNLLEKARDDVIIRVERDNIKQIRVIVEQTKDIKLWAEYLNYVDGMSASKQVDIILFCISENKFWAFSPEETMEKLYIKIFSEQGAKITA
ncbi:MAG: hypothetical protein ABIB11_02600 [Candidatus Omnitrophota bacterium]